MKLDLHGMTLDEAVIILTEQLEEALAVEDTVIELVHGYHSGLVLKRYLESRQFERDMLKVGIQIRRLRQGSTEGSMVITICYINSD